MGHAIEARGEEESYFRHAKIQGETKRVLHLKHKPTSINLGHFATRHPALVLQQVNNCTSMARAKKIVQLCTIFQILFLGRPIVEYEER